MRRKPEGSIPPAVLSIGTPGRQRKWESLQPASGSVQNSMPPPGTYPKSDGNYRGPVA